MSETKKLAVAFRKVADALDEVPDGIEVQSRKCGKQGATPCLDVHVDMPDGWYSKGVCVCDSGLYLADSLSRLADGMLALTAAANRLRARGVTA